MVMERVCTGIRLELFRVRDFNRVDRVERVEVGGFNHEIHETHEN